jgi:hypothetical protein
MAADLITLAEGALLTQFLTPTAKHYGEAALKRIQQLGERAKTLLSDAGREAQAVEEKVLFPLVQAASLESDATLANLWAALLANAADPVQQAPVQPGFVEVLRQLTPVEARVLKMASATGIDPKSLTPHYISIELLLPKLAPLTQQELKVFTGNLTRLGLCLSASRQEVQNNSPLAARTRLSSMGPGFDIIQVTPFGLAFLAAATPPTS